MREIIAFALFLTAVHCFFLKSEIKSPIVALASHDDNVDWWKNAVIYQIYPRSFKDSNNDGIGDLRGVIGKLDYIADLGVDAFWLSPIYKSPMVDGGYDVSDYRAISEEYGTLDDFKELLTKAHKLGIKVILDFVPNHTSDLHDWFNKSTAKEAGYEDYYIWEDGKVDENGNRTPPNNWLSMWKNSAWEWNEKRQQYYFHQFSKQQPDLNHRNDDVRQQLKDVLKYWLDMGVDGFRMDAVPHIFEDEKLRDEPVIPDSGVDSNDWDYLDHVYTKDQPETFDLVYEWRQYLDNYTATVGGDTRIIITECATNIDNIARYYGNYTNPGAHFSLNFNFLNLTKEASAPNIFYALSPWFSALDPDFHTLNWLTGNHDNHRVASRVGTKNIDAYNMLITVLPGVTVTYMGEEIGQEDGEVTCEEGQDPSAIGNCSTFDQISRDFERTPFQWDATVNAGFNEGAKPWLPVSSKYINTNLASQKDAENSHYSLYKQLIKLKSKLNNEPLYSVSVGDNVLFVSRFDDDMLNYHALVYNVNNTAYELPSDHLVVAQSANVVTTPGDPVTLKPGDCVIFYINDA